MEPNVNVNEVSRISTGTIFKGEISSSNDIRIDGTFEGKIYSKGRVVVGEKARIKGDIICTNVDFWGSDLTCELPGFEASVAASLADILADAKAALAKVVG